ncbi:response regulator, partial [Myxococcota bacterium]|nr:response regulator [Myxococcota bacterium]
MSTGGIKVLVVDDSAVVRQALRNIFEAADGFGEVLTAADGRTALRKITRYDPDVITLDVEMPGLDGLATLKRIMELAPRPVVMLSAYTSEGAHRTVRALELGAVDFIQKPGGSFSASSDAVATELVAKVRAVAPKSRKRKPSRSGDQESSDAHLVKRIRPKSLAVSSQIVVAIGASTGGTEAIRHILSS